MVSQSSKQRMAASWLPPIVEDCKSDSLPWDLVEWPGLTVRDVASRLMVAMLKLSHNGVQVVSKELVIQLKMWSARS